MPPKKAPRRAAPASWAYLDEPRGATATPQPARLPARAHAPGYHRPYLLDRRDACDRLLAWFDARQHDRDMPWRQAWAGAHAEPRAKRLRADDGAPSTSAAREDQQQRAYQVWISEIMLQQTRVETVRSYWTAWMDKWPTIHDLAQATVDDVLSAWRGLGYYSRARRIHEAACKVVGDPALQGHLPEHAAELCAQIPGIGPYTAGAISSIVFGHAAPLLDGNVARVLSRQAALYADPRAKSTTDLQWEMARRLVEFVAPETPSDVPGRWNQGLMELGSTLCTPTNPGCAACPIQATCLAYAEGESAAQPASPPLAVPDIENACTLCQPMPDPADEDEAPPSPPQPQARRPALQQMTLMGTAVAPGPDKKRKGARMSRAVQHAQLFPMRAAKQAPRTESRLVCVVRHTPEGGAPLYLVTKRPEQGLLAGLWEFPTRVLTPDADPDDHAALARALVHDVLVPEGHKDAHALRVKSVHSLGALRHEFTHLHWAMQVLVVDVQCDAQALARVDAASPPHAPLQWLTAEGVESASMATGVRRCWQLVLSARE